MKHCVGLLSTSDMRARVHASQAPFIESCNDQLVKALEASGEVEVVRGSAPIASPAEARREAQRLLAAGVGGTIFHQPTFGWPHLAVIAAQILRPPFLALSPRDPDRPSVNGMLTVGSAFAQLGIPHARIWGNIEQPDVLARVMAFVRAASAVHRLHGQVYGMLGGRSMGLVAAAPAPNLWLRQFGVDVDHQDELEIVRRAVHIPPERVAAGVDWLAQRSAGIEYDGAQLTPAKLDYQVRTYLATKDIIADYGWDFVGLKCHCEMSEHQVVQCLSASLLNDPYDWEGPKAPTPASCEADSDGALTMQLLQLLTGRPVGLLDIRFYDERSGLWVLVNCGAAPTWFAACSDDPAENLARVKLVPAITKYAGGGAATWLQFRAGPVTLARLQRKGDAYQLLALKGTVEERPIGSVPGATNAWPVAHVRMDMSADTLLDTLNANHLHLVTGDVCDELRLAARFLGVEVVELQVPFGCGRINKGEERR